MREDFPVMLAIPPLLPRPPVPAEFVPADYFRVLEKAEIFPENRALEVDLGCGDGSFLLGMAAEFPERNFLGVERLLGRVRKVGKRISRAGLTNAKVLRLESRYTIEWLFPAGSVSRLHLLCPDPWPKAKHHRKRLVQRDFLEALWKVLEPGGEFLFMTDHPEYFEWATEQVTRFGKLELLEWNEDTLFYPKTDFQVQWEAEGKSMQRLRGRKPLNGA